MRRKIALLIALVVMIPISVSYFLWFSYEHRNDGRTIIRNTSNVEEADALAIVEDFNYTDVFGLQGLTTRGHNDTWAYTWANFIDTHVIDYYNYRFETRARARLWASKFPKT